MTLPGVRTRKPVISFFLACWLQWFSTVSATLPLQQETAIFWVAWASLLRDCHAVDSLPSYFPCLYSHVPNVIILGLSGNIVAIYFARRQREWTEPVPPGTLHASSIPGG